MKLIRSSKLQMREKTLTDTSESLAQWPFNRGVMNPSMTDVPIRYNLGVDEAGNRYDLRITRDEAERLIVQLQSSIKVHDKMKETL